MVGINDTMPGHQVKKGRDSVSNFELNDDRHQRPTKTHLRLDFPPPPQKKKAFLSQLASLLPITHTVKTSGRLLGCRD